MKSLLRLTTVFLIILTLAINVFAKPPYWQPRETKSSNDAYIAKITDPKNNKSRPQASPIKCKLSVFDNKTKTLLWSCKYVSYVSSGCTFLTKDGIFISVLSDYHRNSPLIRIYSDGKLKKSYLGKELPIKKTKRFGDPGGDDRFWTDIDSHGPDVFLDKKEKKLVLKIIGGQFSVDLENYKIEKQ